MKIPVLLFLICSSLVFSQATQENKTKKRYYEKTEFIDKKDIIYKDSTSLAINDTISAKIFKAENLITVENINKKDNSSFLIKFYFENKQLFFVRFIEKSPKFKRSNKILEFHLVNGKISFLDSEYEVGISLPPMQMSKEEIDRNFGYNPKLSDDYVNNYINMLYKKIDPNFNY